MIRHHVAGRRRFAWMLLGTTVTVAVTLAVLGDWAVAAAVLGFVAAFGTALSLDARARNTRVARNVRLIVAEMRDVRRELERMKRDHGSDSVAAGSATASAGGQRSSTPKKLAREESAAVALATSGYFDREFYATASGYLSVSKNPDPTPSGAALHYLRYGSLAGHSPHPLIEPEYIPAHVRQSMKEGNPGALLAYLRSDEALTHAWGPIFDPRVALAAHGSDLRKLPCLFDAFRTNVPLPVPAGFCGPVPTSAEARVTAMDHAASTRSQFDAHVPGKRSDWDADAEAAWIADVGSRAVDGEPLVSIVMAAWNRESVIFRAIDSVLEQTYPNWELVVVDDGSTDSTAEVVRAYAREDERIRLVQGDHGGVSRARNLGIEAVHGELIAFLDTDNVWLPRFLELSVKTFLAEPDIQGAYAGMRLSAADGTLTYLGAQVSVAELAKGNAVDMNTLVLRASVVDEVGGFDTTMKRWVDYDLVLRVAAVGELRYMPFIGCDYFDGDTEDRITSAQSANWQFVPMGKHMVDWERLPTPLACRVADRVSVVMLAFQEHRRTQQSIDAVLRTTAEMDVEVVVIDNGSRPAVGRSLSARYAQHPRVSFHRLARNYNFSIGCNVGYARSTGEFVMFLNNDTEVREGWLAPLVERLKTSSALGVQPLLVYPNGTVQTAGTVFVERGGLPVHFLSGHPQDDAVRHGGKGLKAVTAGAMLVRASTFERVRGFDAIYANGYEDIDFCLRAGAELGGCFEVEPRSVIVHEESKTPGRFARETDNQKILLERWRTELPGPEWHHYRDLGFDVPHLTPTQAHARPIIVRPRIAINDATRGTIPCLRWALKIGAGAQASGDKWGDVPFARDLGDALEELQQEVVIDRHGAFSRPSSYLDDVVLTLRGRFPVPRQSGRVNVLWVISRPDLVTIDEIRGYDLVYAASPLWAERMSELSGREVRVMHQATNGARFNPDIAPDASTDDVVFVGGARPESAGRPIVSMALEAAADIGLWGPNWVKYAPDSAVRGDFLPFEDTPRVYRSASIVLNDHWADMAQWGFVNNRTFDAVAAGTPVISDYVEGLEMFDGAVVSCADAETMAKLLQDRSWQPSPDRMAEISSRVRLEHSFIARANTLLDDVLAQL